MDCSFKTNLRNNPASDVTGNPHLPSVFFLTLKRSLFYFILKHVMFLKICLLKINAPRELECA